MKQRIVWLDLWRSLVVCIMLVFHALWDLEQFGVLPAGTMETPAADVIRYFGGGSFILISGMLVCSSRDPVRRGFRILCIGLAVAVVTALVGLPVKFGILVLLGLCMLLCGVFQKPLRRVRSPAFFGVFLLLFVGTWLLTARVRVDVPFLYPLGLRTEEFYSADYWPVVPWAFLYLLGVPLSGLLRLEDAPPRRDVPAALTFLGRHSLVIYLVHQPFFYGICWLLL